jgi:hypothetical protein
MQRLGGRNSGCDSFVITVIALEAESIRITKYKKNSQGKLMDVMLGMDALPEVVMLRPDDDTMTLRKQDRCMNDYWQAGVDTITSGHQEQNRKAPAPWRPVVPQRFPDVELVENVESMARHEKKFGSAEEFPHYPGRTPQTKKEKR